MITMATAAPNPTKSDLLTLKVRGGPSRKDFFGGDASASPPNPFAFFRGT